MELFWRGARTGISACRRPTWTPKITETKADSSGIPIAGIRDGNRLPTSPQLQPAGLAPSLEPVAHPHELPALTLQHVGYVVHTASPDQEPNFRAVSSSPTRPPGSARLINLVA